LTCVTRSALLICAARRALRGAPGGREAGREGWGLAGPETTWASAAALSPMRCPTLSTWHRPDDRRPNSQSPAIRQGKATRFLSKR